VDENLPDIRNGAKEPAIVGPQPFSLENLLKSVDPAPDEETERFVASIYEDRRRFAELPRE
jgi:hypothetical protein